jgi:hypothetical protein
LADDEAERLGYDMLILDDREWFNEAFYNPLKEAFWEEWMEKNKVAEFWTTNIKGK